MADEQWNIDTDGLRVGGKLWSNERWFVIVRIAHGRPGSVWVRLDTSAALGVASGTSNEGEK